MNDDDLIRMCARVIAADKTPVYGYGNTKQDRNAAGELPLTGERWVTPAEICIDTRRHLLDSMPVSDWYVATDIPCDSCKWRYEKNHVRRQS